MYFYLLIWSTSKCESCLTCGPTSELKIPKHFIPEKDLYCYKLIREILSIRILSIHLNKECMHICCWEKNQSLVSVKLSKQNKGNQWQTCSWCRENMVAAQQWLKAVRCLYFLDTVQTLLLFTLLFLNWTWWNNSAIIDITSACTELKYCVGFIVFIYTNLYVITQTKVILPRT